MHVQYVMIQRSGFREEVQNVDVDAASMPDEICYHKLLSYF